MPRLSLLRRMPGSLRVALLSALMLWSVATPALAASSTHTTQLLFGGAAYGQPELCEVPTGEHVELRATWLTGTDEQLDQFMATVIVEVEVDGAPHAFDVSRGTYTDGSGNVYPTVTYVAHITPGKPDVAEAAALRWTFTEEHYDGAYTYPAGTVVELTRSLVWIPRGSFTAPNCQL